MNNKYYFYKYYENIGSLICSKVMQYFISPKFYLYVYAIISKKFT
jgi:hypothetical protein